MKKNIMFTIIGLIIIGLIIMPYCLTDEQQDTISVSIGLIGAIGSLITLIIALLLFDKYGLKKDLIKNQTEIVLDQLEKIKTVKFLIRSKDRFVQFFPTKNRIEYYEMFYSEKLIFSAKYWNYINEVFHISSSIYMPKNITEKINCLKPTMISYINSEELKLYSKVTFWGDNDENVEYGKMNDKEITFQQFYQYWIDILDEIGDWLKDKIKIEDLNIKI